MAGKVKRVSKGMRDKGCYWYKNEILIERLDITADEQQHLKTIISAKEKYRRGGEEKKAKQKVKRRNKEGLTQREQKKQETIKAIKELKAKGLSQSKVSKESGFSIALVKRYWNF